MRGLKLLSTAALAANKNSITRQNSSLENVEQLVSSDDQVFGRRKALQQLLVAGTVAASASKPAFGLDMDAFTSSELDKDKTNCDPKRDPKCIPKLSSDEALCKYGQSGEARGEACKKVKAAGKALPSTTKEKSLGGAYAM